MRVKMVSIESGPSGSFHPGDERDVSDHHGHALIAGRHAADITPRTRETAAIGTREIAAMPDPSSRKLGRNGK